MHGGNGPGADIRRKLVGKPDNERSIPEAEIANQATGGSEGSALRVRLLWLRGDRSGRRCWDTMGIAEAEIRGQLLVTDHLAWPAAGNRLDGSFQALEALLSRIIYIQ